MNNKIIIVIIAAVIPILAFSLLTDASLQDTSDVPKTSDNPTPIQDTDPITSSSNDVPKTNDNPTTIQDTDPITSTSPLTSISGAAVDTLVMFPALSVWVDIPYSYCAGITPWWSLHAEHSSYYPSSPHAWDHDVLWNMHLEAEADAIMKYYANFDIRIYDVKVGRECSSYKEGCTCDGCECYGLTYYLLTSEFYADRVKELGQEIFH